MNNTAPKPTTRHCEEPQAARQSTLGNSLTEKNVDLVHQDRLSHAKNFANELNESRLWKIKISYQKRWTRLRRARKAVEIQYTKPWRHATGPKTFAGKRRSAFNADKGGLALRPISTAMAEQRRFLRAMITLAELEKLGVPPSDSIKSQLCAWGHQITVDLTAGLAVFLWFHQCNRAQQ